MQQSKTNSVQSRVRNAVTEEIQTLQLSEDRSAALRSDCARVCREDNCDEQQQKRLFRYELNSSGFKFVPNDTTNHNQRDNGLSLSRSYTRLLNLIRLEGRHGGYQKKLQS